MTEAVMPVKFTRHNALQAVKKMYGDVESFVQHIADEHPDYLDGDELSPEIVASTLGIPMHAFLQVINHPSYQNALDSYAASQAYNLQARIRSMVKISTIAQGTEKLVMSPKGETAYVDRDAAEIIAADKHLRKLQGRPLEESTGNAPGGITIQFGDTINHEEAHQHVHISPGTSQTQIEEARANSSPYRRGQLDWEDDGHTGHERPEAGAESERATEADLPEARHNEEQPRRSPRPAPGRNYMGHSPQPPRQDDADDSTSPHDTPYQPPQPGSGPPAGQARAYSRQSSSQPFQSRDAEIITGPTPTPRGTNDRAQAAGMDKAERIRRIGFGLHQTTPQANEARQTRGTDETPSDGFNNFLGGDTPITGIPKTDSGEEAEAATERRASNYQASREDKLREYLNRDRLVKGDED